MMMDTWLQDAKYGFRMLLRYPAFTGIAVATLALGIGVNTAIFSVVNAVLLRPLPYRDAGGLVVLQETSQRVPIVSPSYPNFLDWRRQSRSFEEMALLVESDFNLSGVDRPERVGGSSVSSNLFRMLGVRPLLGRDFLPAEDVPGAAPVAILTHALWQRRFGGDPRAVGKSLTLDGKPTTVVGILPPLIRNVAGGDLYTPLGLVVGTMQERGSHGDTTAIARLKSGVPLPAARAEMGAIAAALGKQYPDTNAGYGVDVVPLRDLMVGDSRAPLLLLLGAVGLVLLIACANVANLLLARAAAREREFAIRAALGAGRGRVLRQLLTECVLLASVAGAVGLLLADWGISWLMALIPQDLLTGGPVAVDRWVLAFTAALSLLSAVFAGTVPALQASRQDLNETLKEGGRSSSQGPRPQRLRQLFAAAEIAIALVLAINSGLLLKSFRMLLRVDPGFNPRNVLTLYVNLPGAKYGTPAQVTAFYRQALEKLAALPGVSAAAVGTDLPLTGNHSRSDIAIEGLPVPPPGQFPHPDFHRISPGYLKVLGLPLLRGRGFAESDVASSPLVALVSDSLAKRYWPGADAVGKRFTLGHAGPGAPLATVVGVVGDTKQYGLDAQTRLEVYLPYTQSVRAGAVFAVRTATPPEAMTAAVTAAIQTLDPDLPVHDAMTMEQVETQSFGTRRLTMMLLGVFAALALILAAVGIYGVISTMVEQRTHEIGLRMALGAQPGSVLRLIVGQGLRLALAGVALGLAAAAALTRLLASLLFGVGALDPTTFLGVTALLLVVAVAACYVPARRATRVDPLVALRYE
jgi:putative ABC transport system permease protein